MNNNSDSIVAVGQGRERVLVTIAAILDKVVEQAQGGGMVDYAEEAGRIIEFIEDSHFGVVDSRTGELIFDEDDATPARCKVRMRQLSDKLNVLDLDKLASGAPATTGDLGQLARALAGSVPANVVPAVSRFTDADFSAMTESFRSK